MDLLRSTFRLLGLSSSHPVGVVAALLALATGAPALAGSIECQRAIAKASAKFSRAEMNALRRCNDAVAGGLHPGPCPDAKASDRTAAALAKFRAAIDTTCGGGDQRCGTGGDDESLASIGWDMGACPNLEGASCTNAIGDCAGVSDCLVCLGNAAVQQSIGLTYDELFIGNTEPFAVRCRRAIGKDVEKFFATKLRTLQKCQDRVLSGASSGPCPDQKNLALISVLMDKTTLRLCAACGGADGLCGTSDDLSRFDIGFPATCPDVTIPGGASCSAPINDAQDVVRCLECVNEFKVDCLDRASVPALATYPPECS